MPCVRATSHSWHYNPQKPQEILFKRCTNIQEISTHVRNPCTTQQFLINSLNLITQCGLYQRNLEDWKCKPIADQTWNNLRPFIHEAYQRRLTLGTITSAQGGFAPTNRFDGLMTNKDSDDNIAKTIAGGLTVRIGTQAARARTRNRATRTAHTRK
jgi:hypothetical protein